ncbi:MAG TPA: hypothetical protein VG820_10930 [Fimbriimonadaceae bacterium]|nr:hypothetical protein [Fimbriimonadaceae bacterium]
MLAVDNLARLADRSQALGFERVTVVTEIVVPAAYIVLAIALWRGAAQFGPQDEPEGKEDLLSVRSALGLCISCVATLMALVHLPAFIGFFLEVLRNSYSPSGPFNGGVISFIVSALVFPFGWKQVIDVRSGEEDL